ncbi:MAG: LacI family transcriptional regulator [Ruminococcus sp.]|nr:LacI family transcriptional regulator [Ruminococcus sp.]
MGKVKLKDIADTLHISTVTVSNALSGKKGVSEELRELVFKTARELGYDLKKYEKAKEGIRIGVIVSDKYLEVGASFYWALYQQVAYAASKSRNLTMFEILYAREEESGTIPQMIQERNVAGLLIIGWVKRSYVEKLVQVSGVPIVLLDFALSGIPCDAVLSSNYIGMYKVTRYLLERGHREITFVGSVQDNDNILDRYYGYCKALLEKGIVPRGNRRLEDRDLATGEVQVEFPEDMPTAFACNSDLAAARLYDVLKAHGYEVPKDVSIAAYDDYLFGHPFAEQLTTYHVDMKQMAEKAVKLLQGKINGKEKRFGICYVDSVIIERDSVRTLQTQTEKKN